MDIAFNFLRGILIGAGAILPGISSGILCVVFGLYDKLVDSIINFFKDLKKNILFLLPIVCGTGVGIILFSKILIILFDKYSLPTKFAFIGLILGSIPILLKKANCKQTSLKNLIYLFITLFLSMFSLILERNNILNPSPSPSFLLLIISGFSMSAGIVIPGVSSTVILMMFGVYNLYLSSISSLDFSILIPMGIGLIVGSLIFLKVIEICFRKFNGQTYFAIIGFVIGSVFILYEPISFNLNGLVCVISCITGFFISRLFEKN